MPTYDIPVRIVVWTAVRGADATDVSEALLIAEREFAGGRIPAEMADQSARDLLADAGDPEILASEVRRIWTCPCGTVCERDLEIDHTWVMAPRGDQPLTCPECGATEPTEED